MFAANAIGPVSGKTYIEDVFSTYLYTGNSSTQTITNGIDLANKGGLAWIKSRSAARSHFLADSARGATKTLSSDAASAETTDATRVSSFASTGFSLGASSNVNNSAETYVSHTFRKAAKFFDVVTYTGNGTSQTINHSLGQEPGVIFVKALGTPAGTSQNWAVYHRSLGAGNYLMLNSTNASGAAITLWNNTAPTASGFSVGATSITNHSGEQYVAYLFAHDTSADGLIQCGTFTTTGTYPHVDLGWEPQWLLVKPVSGSGAVNDWFMYDVMRGWHNGGNDSLLRANTSGAEQTTFDAGYPTATGFQPTGIGTDTTFVYMVIRRGPMKPPTSGTQVYNAIARTGTGAAATVTGVGFPPDLILGQPRSVGGHAIWMDKLRGPFNWLASTLTSAEQNYADTISSFNMDGYSVGADATGAYNYSGRSVINYFFRRYPGVFDIVCYTGTGAAKTEAHGLGAVPELMIVKNRTAGLSGLWMVYAAPLGNTKYLALPQTWGENTGATVWNSTTPSASVFSLGTQGDVNNSGTVFISYLFATLAGISKVFTATKVAGVNKDVDCQFAAGARFVLLKSTGTGPWYLWDSVRGIVAGSDPYLLLNSTAAEVTGTDYIDPYAAGFTIVDGGLPNGDYIGVAIS